MVSIVRQSSEARACDCNDGPEADALSFVCGTRTRQQYARYPELFAPEPLAARAAPRDTAHAELQTEGRSPLFRRMRPAERGGSGLVAVALRHDRLTQRQRRGLSVFRLEQCVLCDWYDPALVLREGRFSDPAFDALPDDAMHVLVGTAEGTILSYFCMEPAAPSCHAHSGQSEHGGTRSEEPPIEDSAWTLADRNRPLFPTERDLFGPSVFASLRPLARVPITRIRELNYLLRNQAVPATSRLGTLAVVEAISAMAQLLLLDATQFVAVVGHVDLEARRLTRELDMPILYAPHMPTVDGGPDSLWSRDVDLPGRFWPFVIAVDDVVAYRAYFDGLDTLLNEPMNGVLRALIARRREPSQHPPLTFAPFTLAPGASPASGVAAHDLRLPRETWVSHLYLDVVASGEDQAREQSASMSVRRSPARGV